jgi:hypothetical protein
LFNHVLKNFIFSFSHRPPPVVGPPRKHDLE